MEHGTCTRALRDSSPISIMVSRMAWINGSPQPALATMALGLATPPAEHRVALAER